MDRGRHLRAQGRGKVLEEGLEFGGVQAGGDDEGELNEEATEGDEGQEQVAGAGLDGLGGQAKLEKFCCVKFEPFARRLQTVWI